MKCAMSSPGEDSDPAGAGPMISKGFGGSEATRVALGHERFQIRRQGLAEGRMLHVERRENVLVDVVVE